MKTVLVTGGIASGKSEVCRYLSSLGWPVYDSDSRTKALYSKVPGLKERIEHSLGVPFSEIGVIFKDEDRRAKLESLVYPLVLEDILRWKQSCGHSGVLFLESAIAMEKPLFDGTYDRVLLVRAPLEQRLARNPRTAARLAAQHEPDPSRADYIIDNDSTVEELHAQVDRILKTL